MTNFLYDNTSLAFPKVDLNPLPVGANPAQWFVASDWNAIAQAAIDMRGGIQAGKYFGFTEQASDPNPTSFTSSWLWVKTSDKQLYHRRSDSTTRAIADKSSNLLPDTDSAYALGDATHKWLTINGVTITSAINSVTGGTSSQNYSIYADGVSAGNAAANTGRIKYNNTSKKFEGSQDNVAYKVFLQTGDGFASPLTTKGDILVFSTVNDRLAIGTNDQALIADSAQTTGMRWGTVGTVTGSGILNRIATWSSSSALTSSADFTWDGTTFAITGNQTLSGTFSSGGAKFTVDANGNITKINNVVTSFPALQGASSTVLTNNGSGVLSWTAPAAGTVTGSGTLSQLAYWSSSSALTSDAGYAIDSSGGGGTQRKFVVLASAQANVDASGGATTNYNGFRCFTSSAEKWFMGRDGTSSTEDWILRSVGTTDIIRVIAASATANTLYLKTGNVGFGGQTSPSEKIDVTGNIKASGSIIGATGIAATNGDVTSLLTGGSAFLNANGGSGANFIGMRLFVTSSQIWYIGRDGTSSTDDLIITAGTTPDVVRIIKAGAVANTLHIKAGGIGFGVTTETAATLTFADPWNLVFGTSTGTKIGTATGQKIGFWNKTPVIQPTNGADLTNNVTVGGTTDQISDYTIVDYATDSATIRNNQYQLAKKLKVVNDGMRSIGLMS